MDKYEFQIKTEQMEKLLKKREYKAAAKIADSIDWRKVRNVGLLISVSEIYENLERYEDCNEILNMAYDCSPIGRMIVYKMAEVAVKLGNFEEAIELYKEFIKIAPHDLGRYVLKYKIYQGRGSSIEDQIAILEEYKSREYQEQWAYELATLYYKEGIISKCVEECDDLILWFSEGEYVVKAMELKMRIQPLTASQEEKYRQMVSDTKAEEIQIKPINMDEFNTSNLQAALAEGLQDFIREEHVEELSVEPIPAPWSEEMEETEEEEEAEEDIREVPEQMQGIEDQKYIPGEETSERSTIEDILNGWEETKKETEAAIEEAAKRDEEKRRERERLRATGQLPELNTEVIPTLPEEIQRLIDEIEGKIPVRIHVEPIERGTEQEKSKGASETGNETKGNRLEETQDIATILELVQETEEPAGEEESEILYGFDDISDILEAESLDDSREEKTKPPIEKEEQPEEESSAPSPMMEELEKALEEELGDIPPGHLSEEQKKLFAYFTSVRGMNHQLAELLEEDRMRKGQRDDSLVGNIVITGEGGTGKSTLASDIVKALQKQRKNPDAKMAKVDAGDLNGKNVSTIIKKLDGGALLIEKAGRMKTQTAVQLSHAMTRKTGGLLVILEDEKEEIRDLFIRCESLGAKFTRTIELPTFTNKELVAFGESYAKEQECVLDEMAILALYNQIGNRQTSDHLVNVAEVKDIIDEAMERGDKKGLFGKRRKGRTDEFGNLILLEKDFE